MFSLSCSASALQITKSVFSSACKCKLYSQRPQLSPLCVSPREPAEQPQGSPRAGQPLAAKGLWMVPSASPSASQLHPGWDFWSTNSESLKVAAADSPHGWHPAAQPGRVVGSARRTTGWKAAVTAEPAEKGTWGGQGYQKKR